MFLVRRRPRSRARVPVVWQLFAALLVLGLAGNRMQQAAASHNPAAANVTVHHGGSAGHHHSRASEAVNTAVAFAKAQLGLPYCWGGTGPSCFDCSGLVMMAYGRAGVHIPRTSQQQWAALPHIEPGKERAGDLVFFAGSDGTMRSPGHVMIVVSRGHAIEAPQAGEPVHAEPYGYGGDLVGFARPAALPGVR
jgi:cell wall-associated NlpC family hydrolase